MGKAIVVTGATAGIGYETVKVLLKGGSRVIGVGRDVGRIQAAKSALRAMYPGGEIEFVNADISSGAGIENAAKGIKALSDGVSALLHVAGAVSGWHVSTPEGFELTFATNHLAPYRLTHALMGVLDNGGRVITVSSNSHRGARIYWDDVMLTRKYNCLRAYKQSKLCNVLFTMELERRFGVRLIAMTFDPGLVRTDIGLKNTRALERVVWRMRMKQALEPSVAGESLAAMALDEKFSACNGLYYQLGCRKEPYAKATADEARRLWALSARLSGIEESWSDEFSV